MKSQVDNKHSLEHYDVVISGAGPAGLAAAWGAAQQGKKVLLVNDRDFNFVRPQRIFLDEASRLFLLGMLKNIDLKNLLQEMNRLEMDAQKFKAHGLEKESIAKMQDAKFLKEMTRSTTIAVKDIERYIYRRLTEDFKKEVTCLPETTIQKIKLSQGLLEIQDNQQSKRMIAFNNLIAADGAKHQTANVMNEDSKEIKYAPVASPYHRFHAAINFTLEREDGKELNLPSQQFIESLTLHEQKKLISGVSLDHENKNYQANKKKIKCTFGGEVPKIIFDAINLINSKQAKLTDLEVNTKKKLVLEYINKVMGNSFAEKNLVNGKLNINIVHKSKKHGVKKDKMKLQAFETNLEKADKAAVQQNGHRFVLIGDAYRMPNYQFGHGLNHALAHAQFVSDKVLTGISSTDQYNVFANELSSSVETPTKLFNIGGRSYLVDEATNRAHAVQQKFSQAFNPSQSAKSSSPRTNNIFKMLDIKKPINFERWLKQTLLTHHRHYNGKHTQLIKNLISKTNIVGLINDIQAQFMSAAKNYLNKPKLGAEDYKRFVKHLSSTWGGHSYSRFLALMLKEALKAGVKINPDIAACVPLIVGSNFNFKHIDCSHTYEKFHENDSQKVFSERLHKTVNQPKFNLQASDTKHLNILETPKPKEFFSSIASHTLKPRH